MPDRSQKNKETVIILGGGVAGLSAAHELLERGFKVKVFERKITPGGKARSVKVPNSSHNGREPLPGEHGFRFFPGCYAHLDDTMKRIPLKPKGTVFENLQDIKEVEVFRHCKPEVKIPCILPKDISLLWDKIKDIKENSGIDGKDLSFFTSQLWKYATSCQERWYQQFEKESWKDFADPTGEKYNNGIDRGIDYKQLLSIGLTQLLVAARPNEMSARTGASMLWLIISDIIDPEHCADRVLKGPTNEVWIEPWLRYLYSFNSDDETVFEYNMNQLVESIRFDVNKKKIEGVEIIDGYGEKLFEMEDSLVKGDYYLFAIPIEKMVDLITPELVNADPFLANLESLAKSVDWMTGIQYYLQKPFKITEGHASCADSKWAVTSLTQQQFWKNKNLRQCGRGLTRDILSVDISDWNQQGLPDRDGNPTIQAKIAPNKELIAKQVWEQLKHSMKDKDGNEVLTDDYLVRGELKENVSWFLDPSIEDGDDIARKYPNVIPKYQKMYEWFPEIKEQEERIEGNLEPLLVNKRNTWDKRPTATTKIQNMFLASDYVQTNIDLACMEGANEAARRAVNGILHVSKNGAPKCRIWDMREEASFLSLFKPYRRYDKKRFQKNPQAPWEKFPWWITVLFGVKVAGWIIKLIITGRLKLWGVIKIGKRFLG